MTTDTTDTIPRIIFQTWRSKTDIPENFRYWSKSFKELNHTYLYRLCDDADNRALIEKEFPWFLERYDSYPAEIYRADAVRYFFLYKFGGIYVDMDTECIKPLDDLLGLADVLLGRMGTNPESPHAIPNAIMLSKPKQEFWLLMMSLMLDAQDGRPEFMTGPAVLHKAANMYIKEYREDSVQNRLAKIRVKLAQNLPAKMDKSALRLLSPDVLYPVNWQDPIHDRCFRQPLIKANQAVKREDVLAMFPNSYMITYWWHTWENQGLTPENNA